MLFTSTVDMPDLLLADGALEGGDGECTTLILENHGAEKLRLKKGTILGTVSPVDEVTVRSSGDSHEGAVDSLEWGEGATSNVDHTEPRSDVAAMGLNMEVDGGENLAMVGSPDTELTEAAALVISQPHSEVGRMAIPTTSASGPPSKEENMTTTLTGPTTCLPKGDRGAVHQMFSEPHQRASYC